MTNSCGSVDRVLPPDAEAEIRTLVHAFYSKVREDGLLGPVFNARIAGRWEAHLDKMCDFWSTLLYGTGRFRGNPVVAHATLPEISGAHFDRWIELFKETASEVLPSERAADIVGRSLRMRVVLERVALAGAAPWHGE